MTDLEILRQSEAICQTLRRDEDGVRREVLTHAGSRWSLGVLHALGVYGVMRHAELARQLSGITQRMLTKTCAPSNVTACCCATTSTKSRPGSNTN